MKKNILIIFGSRSTEHDISILTALQVISAIDKTKYDATPVYISQKGKWFVGESLLDSSFYTNINYKKLKEVAILPSDNYLYIKKFNKYKSYKRVDCAIISCHGKNGEDGTIQGLLELSQIPYQSSGVDGSSIGLDKALMKQIFAYNKIPITKYIELTKQEFENDKSILKKVQSKVNLPVVVKPNRLGSSIGISVCKTESELLEALKLAFIFDNKVLVEECIENLKEVNISVLGNKNEAMFSITEEVKNKSGMLSFDEKYLSNSGKKSQKIIVKKNEHKNKNLCNNASFLVKNGKIIENFDKNCSNNELFYTNRNDENEATTTQNADVGSKNGMQNMDRIIPANITKKQLNQIQKLSLKIFKCLNSKGVVRIDFMIDTKTQKVYANEINTIPGSFSFYLWEKSGMGFAGLVDKLIDIAEKEKQANEKITSTFVSSVLSSSHINLQK